MALLASDIMTRAGILLQDVDHLRWTLTELAEWINDGVRSIVLAKPSESTAFVNVSMVAGTRQSIPSTGTPTPQTLLSITRNIRQVGPPLLAGSAIMATSRSGLDARMPDWHDERRMRRMKEVRQFFVDEQDPLRFWVFPGNDGTGIVEALVSALPAPVTATGDTLVIGSWSAAVGLKDIMATPLLDYVLYRAQSKDDVAANAGRAQAHFQAFAAAVGIKTASDTQNTAGNRRNG